MGKRTSGLKAFIVPTMFFALYMLNVLVARIQVLMGNSSPTHIGDVGEFLLLFATSITFVIATLRAETAVDGDQANNS